MARGFLFHGDISARAEVVKSSGKFPVSFPSRRVSLITRRSKGASAYAPRWKTHHSRPSSASAAMMT